MRRLAHIIVALLIGSAPAAVRGQQDGALPSWNESTSKRAIVDFVARVTREGSPDFLKPEDRIAVFDNDGTLWCEQPVYFQVMFAFDRIKALAEKHPEWKDLEPYKSVLAGDMKGLAAMGDKGLLEIIAATHSGMTTEEFSAIVRDWMKTARHPKYNRPYNECVYQPMIELLAYLRANGFKTYIVSGGGVEFMRPWTEQTYGIPPQQVIGSSGDMTCKVHLDSYNQLDYWSGKSEKSARREIFYYDETDLMAVRVDGWKIHLGVKYDGSWWNEKKYPSVPYTFNLLMDPMEKMDPESHEWGYIGRKFFGQKLWAPTAVGPVLAMHLKSLSDYPPRQGADTLGPLLAGTTLRRPSRSHHVAVRAIARQDVNQ
jgi:phosphoglycolate phosphatase-like HAD superfamily hydrolase